MFPAFRYHLWTIGCQMNEADATRAAALLETVGGAPAPDAPSADLLLLNTCVVRQQAEDKIHSRLRYVAELKRRRPALLVVLMGCMVGANPDRLPALRSQYPFVDLFLPPSDLAPLRDLLSTAYPASAPPVPEDLPVLPPSAPASTVLAHLPAVLGCSHACAYCIIPYRRGPERSRPSAVILREARALAARGVREITLLGQIIDRYGLDLPGELRLSALLRAVAAVPGIRRVRFLTGHPNWFTPDLLDAAADTPAICPYFEIPAQAGSDRVLAAMRRGYTADDYRRLVDAIRARLPSAGLSTDIIVGFPGETDSDFAETVRLMRDVRPDMMRIAKYSPRPLTLSARTMPDDVPPDVKETRRLELESLLRDILTEKHAAWTGRTVEILVESREPNGRLRGRTPDAKLVFVEGAPPTVHPGDLLSARIRWAGPFSMIADA